MPGPRGRSPTTSEEPDVRPLASDAATLGRLVGRLERIGLGFLDPNCGTYHACPKLGSCDSYDARPGIVAIGTGDVERLGSARAGTDRLSERLGVLGNILGWIGPACGEYFPCGELSGCGTYNPVVSRPEPDSPGT